MKPFSLLLFVLSVNASFALGQKINHSIPSELHPASKYLFYLHGGVVQDQGANAVSQYYGAYKYLDILDSLKSHGFEVISEVRPKDTKEEEYANKVALQIDTLLQFGIPPEQIIVVGASLGAYITIETAYILKNRRIKYAILGLCSEYALDYFSKYENKLRGNFLSIYESQDEKSSCESLFKKKRRKARFKEIQLTMGNGHAFLYKPYEDWVLPLVEWIDQ